MDSKYLWKNNKMIMKLIQYTDKHTEFVNKIYGVVVSKKMTNRGLYKLLATIGLLKSYIYYVLMIAL